MAPKGHRTAGPVAWSAWIPRLCESTIARSWTSGRPRPTPQVAGYLFNAAKNGNVTAQIFWLKTRAKWRETAVELKHSGFIAREDLSELSDEELLGMIYTLGSEVGLGPVKTIEAKLGTSMIEQKAPNL
jgi:hypothetical protein